MDRFEDNKFTDPQTQLIKIYIPVWIDLKMSLANSEATEAPIYIPVWIDLKVEETFNCFTLKKFTFQYG